jgi:predicted transposase YbfD/YdcC
MEDFGQAKEGWLRRFLELPQGIPSHDTFGRVFARLRPREFEARFSGWVRAVLPATGGELVPVDGKTLRRSHDRSGGQAAIELVSAWARSNRLTLGQVKVAEEIAAQIRDQGADYVLALKGNHPQLHTAVSQFFDSVRGDRTFGFKISRQETTDGEHGRIETRQYWQVTAPDWLPGYTEWRDLQSVGLVETTRELNGQRSTELRYYLSSLAVEAGRFSEAVRGHWAIENSCHWILDVAFSEDDSRVRVGFAAENFALLRRIALNLLQQEQTLKRGIKTKRLKAGWDEDYLLKILNI